MSRSAPSPLHLATAGIGVVGVSFGMARYGYGLLLPDFRREFDLSPGVLGAIGTASYVAYLGATALTGSFTTRIGSRRTAVAAGLLAAIGMTIAGVSQTPATFVAGILIGGASAGLAFPPFSDAVLAVAPAARGRVLSAISCGTGYGVALAAPIAIAAGTTWRSAWLGYAVLAVAAAAWAAHVMPGPADAPTVSGRRARPHGWSVILGRRMLPLLAAGVLLGLGSSAYWTFAVEHLTAAGALSPAASRSFLGVVGLASIIATLTADLVARVGAARACTLATLAEATALALLALIPTSLAAALASAVLFGAAYNAAVAIQALWSAHIVSERPSLGLSANLCANGVGLLLGTLGAGILADRLGLATVLILGAGTVAVAGLIRPRQPILAERAPPPDGPNRHGIERPSSPVCTPPPPRNHLDRQERRAPGAASPRSVTGRRCGDGHRTEVWRSRTR